MKFNKYVPTIKVTHSYDLIKKTFGEVDGAARVVRSLIKDETFRDIGFQVTYCLGMESLWLADARPYYRVHPSLTSAFLRTKLSLPMTAMGEIQPITIEMSETETKTSIKSIIVSVLKPRPDDPEWLKFMFSLIGKEMKAKGKSADLDLGFLYVGCDVGERVDILGKVCPKLTFYTAPIVPDMTFEENIKASGIVSSWERHKLPGEEISVSAIEDGIRLALMVSMLKKSGSSMLVPDVLACDREKYNRTGDEGLVAKARKRGVNGYTIGAQYADVPHIRRPHLAIRRCGKNWCDFRVVEIAQTIVNRKKVTEVPQGRYESE